MPPPLLQPAWLGLLFFAALYSPCRAYTPLSDHFLALVPAVPHANIGPSGTDSLLGPLLQPRAAGTPGHAAVQAHLVRFFATRLPDWTVAWENSTGPSSDTPRQHLIFRREPPWTRAGEANMLALAAHYSTPPAPGQVPAGFVGAADAAVSCALLLHVARSLEPLAAQMYREMAELGEGGTVPMDMGLQLIFVDGAGDDPGGRAGLASALERHRNPASTAASHYGYPSQLNQIRLLVLLDLLGGAHPRVPSRFQTTHWAYAAMATVEQRLRTRGLLESASSSGAAFLPDAAQPASEHARETDDDDHVPFMERGVPALPVVPDARPAVWHTEADDAAHLDLATVRDWSRILTGFVLEWLDMMEVEPPARFRFARSSLRARPVR